MSEFEKLKVVARYELLKQLRRKRFYGGLIVTVLAVLLTIGLYHGLNLPQRIGLTQAFVNQYGAELFAMMSTSVGALAILAAVFFSGDAIAGEFERGTGYVLLPNPVKRRTLIVGKYVACFMATAAILAIAFLISAVSVLISYGSIPGGMLGSLGVALALASFVISLSFAFSSVLKGGMGATIAALLTYMVVFGIVSTSLSYAGYDPWFMPDRAGDSMGATYSIPLENAFGGFAGGGQGIAGLLRASQNPTLGFFVLMTYAAVLFFVSLWMANRREMI
ncbi:MAG: ABC transporter permease [Candidatus Hadarchaeota archaeon]